ncbi:MAG: Ig-like domain-containing protein, partial [SAR324 cluster bacterium]|nr:Ig-like domain-containing protein [SAR324 cluster bacterium]
TVSGGSTVSNSSAVRGGSTVQGGSNVSNNSTVRGGSNVTNGSTVQGGSTICNNSTIDNSTIDNSTICNDNVTMSIVDRTVQNQTITETVPPTVSSTTIKVNSSGPYSAADSASTEYCNTDIKVTFSEAMDNSTLTVNRDNASCSSGSIRVSSNNFATNSCVQMASDPSSSDNMTFTLDPGNLSNSTTFKIKVTTAVKDTNGNPMSSDNTTGTGFSTSGDSGKNGC